MTKEQRKKLRDFRNKKNKEAQYYHTDAIKETGANYHIIFGERSNGKSYAVKKEILLKDALDNRDEPEGVNKKRFMYVRRYSEDVEPFAVEQYLQDMMEIPEGKTESPLMELSDGQFNDFKIERKKIFAIYRNPEGEIIDKYKIGYYLNVGDAERIKSQSYLDVYNIVMEEFIATSKPYLTNEPALFENIVSTVARRRRIMVWLVGNSNDRDNLYFRFYGLDGIKKQKEGTIDVYEKLQGYEDGEPVTIKFAVEFCPDIVKSTEGMHYGQGAKNNTGDWASTAQPCMDQREIDELEDNKIYSMFVIYHDLKYYCQLFLNKEETGYFWYVKPWNRLTLPPGSRIVSDLISTDPMTTAGFVPVFNAELKFFKLLEQGKCFFCDDLTGTEFKRACKYFFTNKLYMEG